MRVPDPESNPITNARTTKYRLAMASYPHLTHVVAPAAASSEKDLPVQDRRSTAEKSRLYLRLRRFSPTETRHPSRVRRAKERANLPGRWQIFSRPCDV